MITIAQFLTKFLILFFSIISSYIQKILENLSTRSLFSCKVEENHYTLFLKCCSEQRTRIPEMLLATKNSDSWNVARNKELGFLKCCSKQATRIPEMLLATRNSGFNKYSYITKNKLAFNKETINIKKSVFFYYVNYVSEILHACRKQDSKRFLFMIIF